MMDELGQAIFRNIGNAITIIQAIAVLLIMIWPKRSKGGR